MVNSKTISLLALTMGEPGGIAAEITIAAWQALRGERELVFFVIGDADHLKSVNPQTPVSVIEKVSDAENAFSEGLPVLHMPLENRVVTGTASPDHARQVIASIDAAVNLAMSGQVGGMVTNPIQKESLYQAGFNFQGHTDYIADLAQKADHEASPVMMLSAKDLRTVPVSVHIALKDVADTLSKELIISQTLSTASGLSRWFALPHPRIGITGLNPHAGEGGAMGREEIEFIGPAVTELQGRGFDVLGPLPADTVFHEEARANYDVIICMYHDQALIPVKTLGFHDGVNTTLGLPFIRTSPDHGTALSLAGTGKANPSSLIAAIRQAASMVQNDRS